MYSHTSAASEISLDDKDPKLPVVLSFKDDVKICVFRHFTDDVEIGR